LNCLQFAQECGSFVLTCRKIAASDDATRTQTLKIYARHTQENAIRLVNYVIE